MMNAFKNLIGKLACVSMLAASPALHAEDIDLFVGTPASSADQPNVLFVIDNTANWSQTSVDGRPIWDSEQEALAEIFRNLDDGVVNVGFLMYTETGSPNSNTDGSYIRAAIRNMDATNKELYAAQIESFDINADKSNGGKAGLAMLEAYMYFAGLAPEAGNNKVKTDYLNNPNGVTTATTVSVTDGDLCGYKGNGQPRTCTVTVPGGRTADADVWDLPGNALDSFAGSPYNSPVPPNYCGKNYIIFISNGAAQDNTSDIRRGETVLSGLGGDTSQISLTPSGSASNPADEWARFMAASDYGITTFTVDVNKRTTGQGPGWTALLESMAAESGGTYYDVAGDVSGISDAVNDALSRILAKNSVFASVALPASANTQSTFLNQVFIGQFRPDADANPRWVGNLKQYKLGFDASKNDNLLRLLDANDVSAIDSGTGFIQPCASSFWTPSGASADNYFDHYDPNDIAAECTAISGSKLSNAPDGPIVEKGGQAYVGRGGAAFNSAMASSRIIKTGGLTLCSGAGCTITDFTATAALKTAFVNAGGATDATEAETIIDWARGKDSQNEDSDASTDIRASLHGDVVHSQPIAIDYASAPTDPAVVVFYGSNDGMLRAVNGNRATSHDGSTTGVGTAPGQEFWAFMPPDFFDDAKRIYENTEIIKFPATGAYAPAAGALKDYGPDGPLTAWESSAGNRYLYLGMRRGARTIYGFNVTNISSPILMFRRGCTTSVAEGDSGCESGWSEIGETWSPMTPIFVDDDGDPTTTPATYLIMGGGYDPCEDHDDPNEPANHDCGGGTKGDRIYVLDAASGAIVQELATERAVPGKITVVPVGDDNPAAQWAYAADTGGNVYRISGATATAAIGSTLPASSGGWTITKIAGLGCDADATTTCDAQRKFVFGPDVVRVPDTSVLAVMVGSGDREKPLLDYGGAAAVQNYFFGMFDDPTDGTQYNSLTGDCGAAQLCVDELTTLSNDPNAPVPPSISDFGWKMALSSGEQVVSGALTVANVVNFSTHTPDDGSDQCSTDLGTALTYNLGFARGEITKVTNIIGGGLVPTPVAGKVVLDDGQVVPFCIGCGGENSAIGGSQVTSGITWTQPKSRVYWKIEK